MFRKLVSNLPFSPQLLSQLSFYGKRLSRESATRRLVLVFAVLAMAVQFFSLAVPAEHTNASSDNDVVFGGITGHGDPRAYMLQVYDSNGGNNSVRALFDYYGITRTQLANTFVGHNINSSAGVYSVGRKPSPTGADVTDFDAGGSHFYVRPLDSWGAGVNYTALHGKRTNGEEFWVLYDCGNIVTRTPPTRPVPPPQNPRFNLTKELIADKPIMVGEHFTYKITFRNTGDQALTVKHLRDRLPPGIVPVNPNASQFSYNPSQRLLTFSVDSFPPGAVRTREYRVKAVDSVQLDKDLENLVCMEVNEIPGVAICDKVAVKIRKEGVPELHKKIGNLSRPKDNPEFLNANNTTVHAGETLKYTLTVRNPGTIKIADYVVQDDIHDILEYADVIDAGGGKVQNGIISWPKLDLKPGETIAKNFTIKIKSPVPSTPTSTSDPNSYDSCLDNTFGSDHVRICVDKPVPKIIEETSSELPNTGVSMNVVLTSFFVAFAAYFFYRNRQLVKEINIIKKDYSGGNAK